VRGLLIIVLIVTFMYLIVWDALGFVNGVSYAYLPGDLGRAAYDMKVLGAGSVLFPIHWNSVERVVYPEMQNDFTYYDEAIEELKGFDIWLIVGQTDIWNQTVMPDGKPCTPDMGWDTFLEYNYRHIRAVVKHYKGRVHNWCIASEMNECRLRQLFGWISWNAFIDFKYITRYVENQYRAVKDEYPTSNVCINYHTSIHTNIHHDIGGMMSGSVLTGKYDWLEVASMWKDYCDSIGIDSYDNYYAAVPIVDKIGDKVNQAMVLGKPVYITETNYPCKRQDVTMPETFDFTEENQEYYLVKSHNDAKANGASGFFIFNLYGNGIPNVYTQEDEEKIKAIGSAFRDGNCQKLKDWLVANLSYTARLQEVLACHENGFGLIIQGRQTKAFLHFANESNKGLIQQFTLKVRQGPNYLYIPGIPLDTIFWNVRDKIRDFWIYENGIWMGHPKGTPEFNSSLFAIKKILYLYAHESFNIDVRLVYQPLEVVVRPGLNIVGFQETIARPSYYLPGIVLVYLWRWNNSRDDEIYLEPGHAYWVQK
jgi:hypothetical protein